MGLNSILLSDNFPTPLLSLFKRTIQRFSHELLKEQNNCDTCHSQQTLCTKRWLEIVTNVIVKPSGNPQRLSTTSIFDLTDTTIQNVSDAI